MSLPANRWVRHGRPSRRQTRRPYRMDGKKLRRPMPHSTGDWGWDRGQQWHWEPSRPLCTEGDCGNGPCWPPYSKSALQVAEGQKGWQAISGQKGLRVVESPPRLPPQIGHPGPEPGLQPPPTPLFVSYSTPCDSLMQSPSSLCQASLSYWQFWLFPPRHACFIVLYIHKSSAFPALTQHHNPQTQVSPLPLEPSSW